MAEEKINWSGKTKRDFEVFFSTNIKKGLSRKNYLRAKEKYGENIIDPDIPENRNFYGMEKKAFDFRAVFSRSAGIFGIVYILSAVIIDLLGFDVKLFLVWAYIFLIVSALLIFMLSEYNYSNLYKISRPRILVIRHGVREKAFAESIVPGDIIMLAKGDIVPADVKIIKSNNLSCSHKFRTSDGEHNLKPYKTHRLEPHDSRASGFEADILYASDVIESGRCTAVVFATGSDTLIAQSAGYANNIGTAAPSGPHNLNQRPRNQNNINHRRAQPALTSGIQKNAARVSKSLFLLSAAFAVPAILSGIFMHRDLILVILTCLTASAAAFSEQLTILVDFALTYGMKKSALFGAVIKKTADIDKLNKIDMIIAKKNEICPHDHLRFDKIYFADEAFEVSYENRYDISYIILNAAAVCDSYSPAVAEAIFEAAEKLELNYLENKKLGEVISGNGIISAPVLNNKNIVLVCLGEADNIIEKCTHQLAGGELFELVNIPALERKLIELYDKHDLVMAVALKELASAAGSLNTVPADLDFWIFAAFSEVKVPEVREDINSLKNFGVTPVMITETSGIYTYKTALKFGVINERDDYSNAVIADNNIVNADLNKIRIIERLSEKNNIKLLRALNLRGKYAAVTASNISESEILNESYISFCHANIKDEVLKNKSSVNMKNMSLKLILKALKNANLIYKNALSVMIFSAGLFIAQYLLIFFASVFNGAYILNPAQIIWSSVGAGFFCAAAISANAEDSDRIKKRRTARDDRHYFKIIRNQGMITGLFIFLAVMLTFLICFALQDKNILEYIGSHENINSVQTAAFLACIIACFTNSARYIKDFFRNKIFMTALTINIILAYIATAVKPVREYLDFGAVDLRSACVIAVVGIAQMLIFTFAKK